MRVSEPMQLLRDALDAEGVAWRDASDEWTRDSGYTYHMERTKVRDKSGSERASCIWGYTVLDGMTTGMTYGWPCKIECMSFLLGSSEPEPMSVEGIVSMLKGEEVLC